MKGTCGPVAVVRIRNYEERTAQCARAEGPLDHHVLWIENEPPVEAVQPAGWVDPENERRISGSRGLKP